MILPGWNLPFHASFEVELPPEQTYPVSFEDRSCLNLYLFYRLLISLKQNFLSLYEYLYRDFNRALFTNSMIEHLSVFEKVDVDCNWILLLPTLHISNFRELSILHLGLIVFFLNWSTRSHVYFRFYLSSSMPSLSLIEEWCKQKVT